MLAALALLAGLIAVPQALAAAGDTALVSRVSGADGAKGNQDSLTRRAGPSITADGRFVAFESRATNLHPDATDGSSDIFVRDLEEGTTTLVSRASGAGGAKGNGWSRSPSISADGRYVAFQSAADNLHPDKADRTTDIFVRDLAENTTALVSRASGADGAKGDLGSDSPSISADGRLVAFSSEARNLHPDAEGAGGLEDGPHRHVFVRDLENAMTTLVSRAPGPDGEPGDQSSSDPRISAGGRFVAFTSCAANLHPDAAGACVCAGRCSFFTHVYVRDLEDDTTTWVSRPEGSWATADISADGRFVAFNSYDPDFGGGGHVYVRDLREDTLTLASRARGARGAPGGGSSGASISADGRFVAFESTASNLHPDTDDDFAHVYVRDLRQNTTTLASRASGAGAKGQGNSSSASISADGRFVAFDSTATNLHPDDSDEIRDVFHRELSAVELFRPAKLEINRARIRDRRLIVRGSLDPSAAAGERVMVRFRAAGEQIAERTTVRPNGRIGVNRRLRGSQRRARAGRLIVRFGGNEVLRAASERLRAARRAVWLRIGRVRIQGKRLIVAGRVAPRARGRVRVAIEFNRPKGAPAHIATRTRVNQRGRFRLRRAVPPAVRKLGARVSLTHPGRGRLHGQRLGRDVGG